MPKRSEPEGKRCLIVSLHDFHPGSREAIQEQVAFCETLGVKRFSILAIPEYHHGKALPSDEDSLRWLDERHAAGDDVVLHGYYHDRADRAGEGSYFYTKLYTANEAEFLDLSEKEVASRLEKGSRLWREREWKLEGFIAPAWLMPHEQDGLLRELGFTYTTRLKGVHALRKEASFTPSQSLCYSTRALWRRWASCLWNPLLFRRLRGGGLIRLSLHPNDLKYPAIRRQVGELLERALAEGYQPVSYAEYVAL